MIDLRGKRVLVTGAAGFIGNRVVERLILDDGAEVVALVHNYNKASRLARFPLRMIRGDVADAALVTKAAEGCSAIVHCAVSFAGSAEANRMVTVEGARNVCEAAQSIGARLIHFSTFSVYGETASGPVDERVPKSPGSDPYGASKLEAERLVQQYQQGGLSATILQPTIVYGPWSFWSTFAAQQLLMGTVGLPDNGDGLCNAVYVDDVVDAVILGLRSNQAAPGPFLISAAAPITWRDYYGLHAEAFTPRAGIVGLKDDQLPQPPAPDPLISIEIRYHFRSLMAEMPGARKVYQAAKRILRPQPVSSTGKRARPTPPATEPQLVLPNFEHLPLLRSRSEVQIQRARTELGYNPRFAPSDGAQIMSAWLRWAGYSRA